MGCATINRIWASGEFGGDEDMWLSSIGRVKAVIASWEFGIEGVVGIVVQLSIGILFDNDYIVHMYNFILIYSFNLTLIVIFWIFLYLMWGAQPYRSLMAYSAPSCCYCCRTVIVVGHDDTC